MKNCIECGQPLPAGAANNRKYCSQKCADRVKNRRWRIKKYGILKCVVCGAEITRHGARRYCSAACAREAEYVKRRAPVIEKVCVICCQPFQTNNTHRKTCSPECRDINEQNNIARNNEMRKFRTPSTSGKSRRCHDCGKPTDGYRCSRCWAKLRNDDD